MKKGSGTKKKTTPSGHLSANARRKSATIKPSKGHPSGRFPINDKKHARLALQDLPKAKDLSSGEEAKIRARAEKKLHSGKKAAKK